jgi:PAS domain-containing protein
METIDRHVHDRLGSALHRLALLEQALEAGELKAGTQRIVTELRRISADLERAMVQIQDAEAHRREMRSATESAERRARLLFDGSPTPCFVLDRAGRVLDANAAGVTAVNTSLRYLVGRHFHVFVSSERERFMSQLQSLHVSDTPAQWPLTIRPRERGSRNVVFTVVADGDDRLLAMLLPHRDSSAVPSLELLRVARPVPASHVTAD